MRSGKGSDSGIVKFVRKIFGCLFFNLHLHLLSQDCKELTLL